MYLLWLPDLFLDTEGKHLDLTRLIWDRRRKGNSHTAEVGMQNAALTQTGCTCSSPGEPGHTECSDNVYPPVLCFHVIAEFITG